MPDAEELKKFLSQHPKSQLIFDLDETLVKLILPWDKVHEEIWDQLKKIDESIYEDYQNDRIDLSQLENSYVFKYGQKAKNLIIKSRRDFEVNYLKDVLVNKELVDFVNESKGHTLYIWSSNAKSTIENALKELGIFEKFSKIVSCEDIDFLKPELDGFKKIYKTDIAKEEFLFIGDSQPDREAAQKAGIDFYLEDYFK